MKTASILTIGCAAMALSITSCTNFGSPNTYNLNEIGGAQETYTGTVTSVLFKGVHYEMMIDAGDFTWKVHSTTMQPAGSRVGLAIVPFNIHIMRPKKEDVAP